MNKKVNRGSPMDAGSIVFIVLLTAYFTWDNWRSSTPAKWMKVFLKIGGIFICYRIGGLISSFIENLI